MAPPPGELARRVFARAVTERVFIDVQPSPPQFANWGTSPKGRGKSAASHLHGGHDGPHRIGKSVHLVGVEARKARAVEDGAGVLVLL